MHDPVFPKSKVAAIQQLLNLGGVLCYHRDADGCTSAAQLLRTFKGFEPYALESPALEKGVRDKIIAAKPPLAVFVDLAIDHDWRALAALRKAAGCRMLLIDHHPIVKDLNSRAVLHFNSHFTTNTYLPASYLVWRVLGSRPADAWLAAIGTYADYGSKECPDVIRAAARAGASWDDVVAGAELVTSAITAKGNEGAKRALKLLGRADSCASFSRDPKLQQWRAAVNEELARLLALAERLPVTDGLRIATIESKLNLVSLVSTILAERHPEEVLVVRKKNQKGEWKLSLRNQAGRVDVGQLARAAARGIGRGGGHAKAAGALVTDWDIFEKRFRGLLAKRKI